MKLSAQDIIHKAYETQPHLKLATNDKENTIGSWSEEHGRYMIVAGKLLDDSWGSLPYELLVNGKPLQINWIPVPAVTNVR